MIIIIRRNDTNVIGFSSVATAVITLSTVSMGADTSLIYAKHLRCFLAFNKNAINKSMKSQIDDQRHRHYERTSHWHIIDPWRCFYLCPLADTLVSSQQRLLSTPVHREMLSSWYPNRKQTNKWTQKHKQNKTKCSFFNLSLCCFCAKKHNVSQG